MRRLLNGRRVKTYWAFGIVTLAACGAQHGKVHGDYENKNLGQLRLLTFASWSPTRIMPVGTAQVFQVTHQPDGVRFCEETRIPRQNYYTGLPDPADIVDDCTNRAPASPVKEVVAVTASTSDCRVEVNGDVVTVRVDSASAPTLEVTARLENGQMITDRVVVLFADVDDIAVRCAEGSLCPGPHAIFEGARFTWDARAMARGERIGPTPDLTAEPAGLVVVEPGYGPDEIDIHALAAGTVTLTLTSGRKKVTSQLRIVADADAASGEVRGLAPEARLAAQMTPGIPAALDPIGPAPGKLNALQPLLPVWTLKSGGFAVGGARYVEVVTPNYYVTPDGTTHADANTFKVGRRGMPCVKGPVQLSAKRGTAVLTGSVEDTCT